MLVISGSDLVGKSTFAQACVDRLQSEVYALPHMLHHLHRIPKWFDACHDYTDRMCVTSIWDRFHLDELAYRFNDDRSTQMTPLRWDLVEAQFRLRCGFQVVLWARDEFIRDAYARRGDAMYNLEHILNVNDTFIGMCDKGHITVRDHTYTVRIDMIGQVTEDDLVTRVCKAYVGRLKEFSELRRNWVRDDLI